MKSLGSKNFRTGVFKEQLDNAGRTSQNTVFGEKIVAIRAPDILEKFQYNISTLTTLTTVSNNGTVTHSGNVAVISSSTNSELYIISVLIFNLLKNHIINSLDR